MNDTATHIDEVTGEPLKPTLGKHGIWRFNGREYQSSSQAQFEYLIAWQTWAREIMTKRSVTAMQRELIIEALEQFAFNIKTTRPSTRFALPSGTIWTLADIDVLIKAMKEAPKVPA